RSWCVPPPGPHDATRTGTTTRAAGGGCEMVAMSTTWEGVHPVTSDHVADDRSEDFARFVAQHDRRLLGFAHLITGNHADAEDILQTALAKAYLKWARLGRDDFNAVAYIRRIIINEHRSL